MVSVFENIKKLYVDKIDERRELKLNALGVSKSRDLADYFLVKYQVKVHPECVSSPKKKKVYFRNVAKLIADDFAQKDKYNHVISLKKMVVSLEDKFEDDFCLANNDVNKVSVKLKNRSAPISNLQGGVVIGMLTGGAISYLLFSDSTQGVNDYVLNHILSFSSSLLSVIGGGVSGAWLGGKIDKVEAREDKFLENKIYAHNLINESISTYKLND
ncbi:MAG: hypothetical protein ACLFN8_02040 [Candidatus Woesearchaeota archaeon]